MKLIIAILATGLFLGTGTAQAQDLTYEPINPSFGGNSFNSAHLLAIANAQNDFERPVDEDDASSDLDRFVRSLESRLLSSLSTQVANAIFGENAQDSGTIRFGDQTISFVQTLDGIELTITEADGSTTVIIIPTFQTTGDEETDEETDEDNDDASEKSSDPNILVSLDNPILLSNSGLGFGGEPLLSDTVLQPIQQPIQ